MRLVIVPLLLAVFAARPAAAVSADDRAIVAGAVVAGGTYFYLHENNDDRQHFLGSSWDEDRYSQRQLVGISLGAGLATYAVVLVFSLPSNSAAVERGAAWRLRVPAPQFAAGRWHVPLLRVRF